MFAEKAGLDSPTQVTGKSDFDLIWKEDAASYIRSDRVLLSGKPFLNQIEQQQQRNILISKSLYQNRISLSFILIDNFIATHKHNLNQQIFHINNRVVKLTKKQCNIYKLIIKGYNAKQISIKTNISPRTVEVHIKNLKEKFQVSHKNSLIILVWQHNFLQLLGPADNCPFRLQISTTPLA